MIDNSVSNGNILLIDPNKAVSNLPQSLNGTPDYEDMFIFVSLRTRRRRRSVIKFEAGSTSLVESQISDTNINMLGYDLESGEFTTKWTENEGNKGTILEGFGISDVTVKTNSSYIPQVTIEFIDIRGLAFFNKGSKSPYQALFDFPPPIFELTLKGYYGKALTYELHLVRHSTQFDAQNGNFKITAEFVARTFAPLTDVPFKYIDVLPLIKQETSPPVDPETQEAVTDGGGGVDTQRQTPNVKLPPRSTHEFIIKLKNLYDGITTIKETSQESLDLDRAEERLADIESNITLLNNFKNNLTNEKQQSAALIMTAPRESSDNTDSDIIQFRELTSVQQYNQIIQSLKTDGNSLSKVKASELNGNIKNAEGVNDRLYLAVQITDGSINRNEVNTILNVNYRKKLILDTKININESKDLKVESNLNHINEIDNNNVRRFKSFVAIDITGYYIKLNDAREAAKKRRNDSRFLLSNKINNVVVQELGFKPTIYNVFKIICDDVDAFFNILRKTNVDAENHHEKFKEQIFRGRNSSVPQEQVSAFPLYISKSNTSDTEERPSNCNVTREVRQYPIELSQQVQQSGGEPFPEITLVDNFITAFIRLQKELLVNDLRGQEDETGNNKWIPITPFDSELVNNVFGRRESPYKDLEFQYASSIDNNIDKYLNKALERYYVLSQYTFGRSFYQKEDSAWERFTTDKDFVNQEVIELYAKGEAYNLAASLTNVNVINNLKSLSKRLEGKDINIISQALQRAPAFNNVNLLNNQITSKYITIGNSLDPTVTDEGENLYTGTDILRLYKNRNVVDYSGGEEELYEGFIVYRGGVVLRKDNPDDPQNPIDKYIGEVENSWFRNALDFLGRKDRPVQFVQENVIYNGDVDSGDDYTTKYLNGFGKVAIKDNIPNGFTGGTNLKRQLFENSFVDVVSDILAKNKTSLELLKLFSGNTYTPVINESTLREAKAFLLGSNFLKARSFYHRLSDKGSTRSQLNDNFLYPSVVEVPYFSIIYMGGIVKYNDTGNTSFRQEVDALINKFVLPNENEGGETLGIENGESDIAHFKLDAFYIDRLMLENDKNKLAKFFNDFVFGEYYELELAYKQMINRATADEEFKEDIVELGISNLNFGQIFDFLVERTLGARLNRFETLFKQSLEREMLSGSRNTVIDELFEPYTVLVPSEFSFYIPNFDDQGNPLFDSLETDLFVPLETTNQDTIKQKINEVYFKKFFSTLSAELKDQEEIVENINNQAQESIKDNDVKGSLYYSFKSISDKWIAGLGADINKGFPLNDGEGDSLIDRFMFVDRGMNPIGSDCIIDVQPLLELVEDYDVNVFSVMSTLLSHNGFEFFPLQNFMSYKDDEWRKSFDTIVTIDQDANPAFVCMYIGGAASQLNNESSEYEDDGIRDLSEGSLQDFNADCRDSENVEEIRGRGRNQPYSEIRAFRVRFAEQNQSFFTNIQLDGREFTETNDSLAILSKIAGDESNTSPIAKGQNLFNVYENRAYSAKVGMLGNMMIQPTQYFQLENIPMYSGAYVILDVEHRFTPNHALTEFQGTKILKYPNPIMSEFAVSVGFQSGTAEDLSSTITLSDIKSSPLYDQAISSGFLNAVSTPSTITSRIDKNNSLIQTLHPQVRTEFARLFSLWEAEGYYLQINSAFRTKQDQSNVTEEDAAGNPIARPGRSFHQYGLAIDVSLRKVDQNGNPTSDIYTKDVNPYWEFEQGNPPLNQGIIFKKSSPRSIVQIAEENGFRWGGRFKNDDPVHFEKTLGYGYSPNDVSKEPIYNGTIPTYSQVGTIDDLIRKFDQGKRIGRYIIFDDEAKGFVNITF